LRDSRLAPFRTASNSACSAKVRDRSAYSLASLKFLRRYSRRARIHHSCACRYSSGASVGAWTSRAALSAAVVSDISWTGRVAVIEQPAERTAQNARRRKVLKPSAFDPGFRPGATAYLAVITK